jgi:fructose-1,6-bisphosphatase
MERRMFGLAKRWKYITDKADYAVRQTRLTDDYVDAVVKRVADRFGVFDEQIKALKERVDTLEKVQRTLCDDIYDLQADMTLIHNIEGYEDWREEIGKPVSKPTDIVK